MLCRRNWAFDAHLWGQYRQAQDFVAAKQKNKLYIQIAERIEREETQQREYGRLLGIADNYPKYVLLADEFAGGNYQGIKTMHIADFLLSEEY